jgi:hypothetical protein
LGQHCRDHFSGRHRASLIFVGFQIGQNTRATQIATSSGMGTALMQINQMPGEPDFDRFWGDGLTILG